MDSSIVVLGGKFATSSEILMTLLALASVVRSLERLFSLEEGYVVIHSQEESLQRHWMRDSDYM